MAKPGIVYHYKNPDRFYKVHGLVWDQTHDTAPTVLYEALYESADGKKFHHRTPANFEEVLILDDYSGPRFVYVDEEQLLIKLGQGLANKAAEVIEAFAEDVRQTNFMEEFLKALKG